MQSVDEPSRQGWVPSNVLTLHDDSPEGPSDAKYRRESVFFILLFLLLLLLLKLPVLVHGHLI